MMDIYLFSAITNIVWYCFTVLFLLYKFTSFFSYIYNFIVFSGRLFNGVKWLGDKVYNFIMYRRGYSNKIRLDESTSLLVSDDDNNDNDNYNHQKFNDNSNNNQHNPMFLEKLKNKIWNKKPYVQKEQLYELHISNFNSVPDFKTEHHKNSKKKVSFNENSFMDTSLHGIQYENAIPPGISYCSRPIEKKKSKNELIDSNVLFDSEFIREHTNLPFALVDVKIEQ